MFATPTPLADLVVEVVSNTDWWQPYIAPGVGLLASLIVAAVAFAGVAKSNNTNREAIESADTRERDRWKTDRDLEREKWHRDNLLRICSEAVRVSREISHHYNEAAGACLKYSDLAQAEDAYWRNMDLAQAAIGKVAPLSYDMELLGETTLYMEFQEVRQVGEYVAPAFRKFHQYLVANFSRLWPDPPTAEPVVKLTADELHKHIEWRRYYKAGQHLSHVSGNFQLAARRRISPESLPKDAPTGRLDPIITPDKHPKLFYRPPGAPQNIYQSPSPFDWDKGDTADPVSDPPTSPGEQND